MHAAGGPPSDQEGAAQDRIPAVVAGLDAARAAGHFTTLQVREGRVQGRDLHLLRLRDASRELYGGGPGKVTVRTLVRECLAVAGEDGRDCTLRILVRPWAADVDIGRGAVFHPPFEYQPPDHAGTVPPAQYVDVQTGPPREIDPAPLRLRSHRGVRTCPGIKHLATGSQVAARDAAIGSGHDDALLVTDDGLVAEGTFWNVAFWDGTRLSWPLAPVLPGVTFRRLDMAMSGAGMTSQRVPVRLDDVGAQRAAVAVNSRGIRAIASIDGQDLPGDEAWVGRLRALLAAQAWEAF